MYTLEPRRGAIEHVEPTPGQPAARDPAALSRRAHDPAHRGAKHDHVTHSGLPLDAPLAGATGGPTESLPSQ